MQPGRRTDVPDGEPTPEEIQEMCKEIRAGWDKQKLENARRAEIVPYQARIMHDPLKLL